METRWVQFRLKAQGSLVVPILALVFLLIGIGASELAAAGQMQATRSQQLDAATAAGLGFYMQEWVAEHRQNPVGVDNAMVETFASWVNERSAIAEVEPDPTGARSSTDTGRDSSGRTSDLNAAALLPLPARYRDSP